MEVLFGTAVVLLAKLFAYAGFLKWLDGSARTGKTYLLFAAIRLLIGLAFGGLILLALPSGRDQMLAIYFGAIAVARLSAWTIVIALLGRRGVALWRRGVAVLGGTLLSYAIDIPIAMGVITVTGGIC